MIAVHVYVKTRLTKNRVYEWKFFKFNKNWSTWNIVEQLNVNKNHTISEYIQYIQHPSLIYGGKGYEDIAET